jgi:hypothetical protein
MALQRLTNENWHDIASYVGFADALALTWTSSGVRKNFSDNFFWEGRAKSVFVPTAHQALFEIPDAKKLTVAVIKALVVDRIQNSIVSAASVSSIDRAVEGPNNTVTTSKCIHHMQEHASRVGTNAGRLGILAQRMCGCIGTGRSCYWSSGPSAAQGMYEYITYRMKPEVSFVVGVSVTPYQAYMHPGAPVYGPLEVCLQLLTENAEAPPATATSRYSVQRLTEAQLSQGVYYQSAYFPVQNTFIEQQFFLPAPVLFAGTRARVVYRGAHQKQTLGQGFPEDYYVCISHCAVLTAAVQPYVGVVTCSAARSDSEVAVESAQAARRVVSCTGEPCEFEEYDLDVADEDLVVCAPFQQQQGTIGGFGFGGGGLQSTDEKHNCTTH